MVGDPDRELDNLLRAATFTVLIGNADAHGKNLALLHPSPGTVSLAPLYDTVPTTLWPTLGPRAAMSFAGREHLPHITLDDIVAEANTWAMSPTRARSTVTAVAERVADAVSRAASAPDGLVGSSVTRRIDELLRR